MPSLPYPDYQGHRGCRGLLPENTVAAMLYALELGVTTLEMDAVITADGKVVLSHEPWCSHEICLDPEGREIPEANEREHNIYRLTYEALTRYDCGSKPHPRFPGQRLGPAHKPLLSDVIAAAEAHARTLGRPLPWYNIETKCTPEGDDLYHPSPAIFTDLIADVITAGGVRERTVLQSFDVRTLQYAHNHHPDLRLALLIENKDSPEKNLAVLGFTPHIYSPHFELVDAALISFCESQGMKLIPWTVNDAENIKKLIAMGVDGIISDYPDKFALAPYGQP